jgi:hypothetical protein
VEFLIGSGAVLGTALPQAALLADAARLASRTVWELELVQEATVSHPAASLANAIARLPFPVRSQSVT